MLLKFALLVLLLSLSVLRHIAMVLSVLEAYTSSQEAEIQQQQQQRQQKQQAGVCPWCMCVCALASAVRSRSLGGRNSFAANFVG